MKMDGYTYIKNVLEAEGRDVDKLLLKLCKRENSAVEFKASFLPKTGSDDNPDACSWNVVSDVIAIANSAGGCILLGIDNAGEMAIDFTCGLSLDEYTRRLHDHLLNKKEWMFDQKKYSIGQKYRDRLKNCITVLNGRAYGKDILIIHIKPSQKPIVYEETKMKGDNRSVEFLTYRSKGAIAQKNQIPLSTEAIEEFLERETSSSFFDQLWDEYSGKQYAYKQNLGIVFTSIVFTLITIAQCFFIYKDVLMDTSSKGFESKFMLLLSSIPIFFLAGVFLVFVMGASRRLILHFVGLCWISFSIASCSFVMKLFCTANETMPYSIGFRILITLCLFFAVSFFCFFLMPILIPNGYKNTPRKGNLPKPDEIIVEHPHFTLEWRCVDAGFWWSDSDQIQTPYGNWKLQRNRVFGNFRLLDPRSIMRCYGCQKEVLKAFREVQKIYEENKGGTNKEEVFF